MVDMVPGQKRSHFSKSGWFCNGWKFSGREELNLSEKEITEQAERMWFEYHGDYPPDHIPAMPSVYIRGFRDALRWVQGKAIYEAAKGEK